MKKLFAAILTLSSFVFVGTLSERVANAKPQVTIRLGQRHDRDRDRDWRWRNRDYRARGDRVGYGQTFTRDVQRGYRVYRETYQVQYLPYGGTRTVLISRVRLN